MSTKLKYYGMGTFIQGMEKQRYEASNVLIQP